MDHDEDMMEDEASLHAYVDGQLDAAGRERVEQRLRQDAAARAAVTRWRAQREELRALQRDLLDEPIPARLLAAAQQPRHRSPGWRPWTQALAAGVLLVLGIGLGWVGHRELGSSGQGPDGGLARAQVPVLAQALARDAMAAHVVYAPDARRPVEIGADQQELLLRWLSKRLGRSLKLPQLDPLGWQLVGGRLLSGDTRGAAPARAQFMYENTQGQRLTLYLSVLASATTSAGRTTSAADPGAAFSYASEGTAQSFFWTDGSFGYALVGELPREALHRLVNEVYAQTQDGS